MSRSRVVCCLWLCWVGVAWSQPEGVTPSATPSLEQVVKQHVEESEVESAPSAKDTSKPAIFGSLILSQMHEKAGTSIARIQRDSLVPWGISLVLLPIYLGIARRRGFVLKRGPS